MGPKSVRGMGFRRTVSVSESTWSSGTPRSAIGLMKGSQAKKPPKPRMSRRRARMTTRSSANRQYAHSSLLRSRASFARAISQPLRTEPGIEFDRSPSRMA